MRTKRILNTINMSILMLFMLLGFTLKAQDKKDKIEAMHSAYITEKVGLTQDEAQKFWPIYNQYHADMEELQKQRRQNARTIKDAGGIDNMKDEEVQKLIANEIDIKSRELDLRKKYIVQFETVLSVKKVAKFFIAEEQFKLYLLEQLKKRRQGQEKEPEFVPQ
jgi:hypothetical protein